MLRSHQIYYFNLLIVICVVCLIITQYHNTSNNIREMQQSGRNFAALERQQSSVDQLDPASGNGQVAQELIVIPTEKAEKVLEAQNLVSFNESSSNKDDPELTILNKVREVTKCLDKPLYPKSQQRGDYWVFYNYVMAEKRHKCHESITYTTHGDYSFLDNVVPLIERWRGPLSIALYAPGKDFQLTLDSIAYLRDCTSPLVRELVTFHVYFSTKHFPEQVPQHDKVLQDVFNCSITPPYFNISSDQMYKTQENLVYPVNVGRNVAREMAQTHFVLASDIELYPSPNIIPRFLKMISINEGPLLGRNPKVFPLVLFEVAANQQIPNNKALLREMLDKGTAVTFHNKICAVCHNIPKSKEWLAAEETQDLHVFHIGKRNGHNKYWEPIFIGTHSEPLYDERLSWEGRRDKMTQGYALCVLDYDFLILDNVFLVHKPGIKVYKRDSKRDALAAKTNQLIKEIIFPELKTLYGVRKGCSV